MSTENQDKLKYCFVVHPPRCGSTLLGLILDHHTDVSITPEMNILDQMVSLFSPDELIQGDRLQTLRDLVKNDSKLMSWKMDMTPYLNTVDEYMQVTMKEFITDLLTYYRDSTASSAHILGFKKGSLLEHYKWLKQVIPELKFIYIYRDSRPASLSMVKTLGFTRLSRAAFVWRRRMYFYEMIRSEYPQDILGIKYEDLVTDPELICQEICRFLEIDFDPAMLQYYETNQDMKQVPKGQEKKHEKTRQQVTNAYVDTWKAELTSEQVSLIQNITSSYLEQYDYSLMDVHVSPFQHLRQQISIQREQLHNLLYQLRS